MKQFLHIFSLLFFLTVNAQDSDLIPLVNQLKTEIQSENDNIIQTTMMILVLGHIIGEHGLQLEDILEMKSLNLFI